MVAVFTGTGLGLYNTSYTQLGFTTGGGAGLGQSRESQYVNLSTGNLVLQDLDESLFVRGLNASFLRTYNSRGTVAGQGQDGWVTGFERNVTLTGTLNAVGSTMTLNTGDGQSVVFVYSGTANRYTTTGGDGAHDTLIWNSTGLTWTYTEGSSQREELYADHANATLKGRLTRIRDLKSDGTAPAQYDIVYDASNRISEVRSIDGSGATADAIVFAYNGATTQLISITTREGGVTKSQLSYGYDGVGRLSWVQTDLTPETTTDNTWDGTTAVNNDGKRFRTSYTYVSTTASDLRIASVSTSDGVTVAYTYESDGSGGFRVKTVTQGASGAAAQITTFTYGATTTDVVDGAGRTWTYEYDANRQLIAMLEPAVGGLRQKTSYTYDASGNLTRVSQAPSAGHAAVLDTVFRYDANGNRTLQRDLLGNTVAWTYNASNQVTAETRYTVADADGLDPTHAGTTNLPSGALVTRYMYDARNRVRFVLNAAGEVRELTYATTGNGIGQLATERRYLGATYTGTTYTEAALNTWATDAAALRKSNSALTEYTYDGKGRLSQTTAYAAVTANVAGTGVLDASAEIARYTYDAQGLLRQRLTVRGAARTVTGAAPTTSEIVDYIYDGLGRLLSQLSRGANITAMPDPRLDPTGYATWIAANDGATVLTAYAYTDSANQIRVTFDTGATRTATHNSAGLMVSASDVGVVSGSTVTRTTQNFYDNTGRLRATQDATGARMYYFYDPAGRLTAVVDGTGAVAKTVYDGVGRVVQTVAYAIRVDTTGWLSGSTVVKDTLVFAATAPGLTANQAWVQTDAVNDRSGSQTYDNAGRLATQTDAAGLVTTYAYDAASRLLSSTVAKPGDVTAVPRVSRMFYDSANRMVATLDAAGYLTETIYDAGGRAVQAIRYATLTNSTYWANGTLAQLRPAANAANDQTTRLFYNARSQQIGMLDAEGHLTEFVYDEANNQRAVKSYAKRLTGLTGTETLATLRTSATTGAPAEAFRLTQRSYNGLGQLVTELNHEGTVTRYSYDEAGRLVKTEAAQGTIEVREGNQRFDVFGNLIGELAGEGSTHLIGGMSETQIDAIYAQYGVRHSYDLVGRRIESIDAAGNKTWYFYDATGRQTFTVRGMHDSGNVQNAQGEVVETRYNAFGQAIDSIAYTGRITLAAPGSRASAQTAISALSIGPTDSRAQFRYDTRGLLSERIDAENYRNLYTYTAFGELRTQQDLEANNSVRRTVTNSYDNRGLLIGQTEAGGALSRSMGVVYDAFGRATTRTDARGNTVTLAYDRLGRMVAQTANNVSGRNESVSTAYDAFSRVVSQTDALGRVTGYTHSDSARSITLLTAEGVSVTTIQNRFGQALTVTQTLPDGTIATTTTNYNKDGQVLSVTDPLNRIGRSEYDARGLTVATVDGSGRRIEYTYDAAGRVLTRREDPAGLNLASTWVYDGQGRQIQVTDASGVRSTLGYDRKGNLLEAILDPAGLALRTTYTWDRDGRQLTMTQGAGTAAAMTIAYAYDAYGRRSTETVSPGVLNLITTYTYDANDNVVGKTDASGRVTRFSYDAANRLRFSVDGAGGVSEVVYDAAGRATMTRSYAKVAVITALSAAPSEAEMATLVTAQTLANDALDEVTYRIYDRDGRLVMSVDGTGSAIEIVYDNAGRKVLERRYAQSVALNATLRGQLQAGTATVAALRAAAGPNAAKDLQTRYVYDAAGQVVFMLDAVGAVTRTWYDAAGRAVGSRRYATPVNFASVTDTTSVATLQAAIVESAVDQGEYRVYDSAGRVAYLIDLAGTLQQIGYDAAGRMTVTRTYATLFPVGTTLRDALRAGTATVADFTTFATTNEVAARAQAMVYDSAGRARYTVTRSAAGIAQVSETQYDAAGRVVASAQYGVNIGFSATYNEAGVAAALNTALSTDPLIRANQIRTQRIVYDTAGRQRFMLDVTGALAEWRYDGAGRVTDTIAYGQRPPATTTTETALSAWANAQPAVDVRRTQSAYDASGRLQVRTDALNKTESFTYDGADRLLTRTDRNNAVWTYQYDASGRRTAELSPQVSVSSVDSAGVVSTATRSIATRFTYDALGNVRTRTDNADAPVTADRRTTTYVYDNRGYQVSTIFPDAGSYNVTTNALEATGVQATIEITYNALGQAVVQKDVRNNYSYKAYDALGRVTHEVDQENNVSSYTYNAFGEVTSMRRFATTLNTGVIAGWTAGQALSTAQLQTVGAIVANANDRTIDTAYTALGQKASVTQSQVTYYRNDGSVASGSPVKTFGYNVFGDLVTESDLLEGVPNSGSEVWATAYRYYDALGRNTLTVDALGYVTETKYNATGEAIETTEYARALSQTPNANTRPGLPAPGDAATGDNRISRWGYDALGRKTSEISVRQYRRIDGSTGSRDVTATYGYDNEGRVTAITDDTGVTLTAYDAIGRTTSVQEPTRATLVQGVDTALGGSTALDLTSNALYEQRSPYTTMAYDAFGNAVAVRRYANGKNGASAAVADDSRDQVQLMRYDWQGRAVWERDGEGAVVTRTYDAADNVIGVRYTLTGNEGRSAIVRVTNSYDKTGRQKTTLTERDQYLSGAFQNTVVDTGETVSYNAFGEITGKTMSGLTGSLAYAYDTTGRLISSNDSGAVRNFGYNLAGHQVRTSQNAYLSTTDGVVVAVTLTRVDKLGRALEVTLPSHNATSSTTSTITQRVDRWGNVVQIIDARGYQTDYEYNSLNQLVRETRPLVKVVAENGGVSWLRPVNQWYYDALGRLVATRDANGNLRSNEYDATGRMTATRDAYGNVTRQAYDALGNQRLMQNALGYLTFKEYDRRGQVTSIGDYLPASNGTSREKTFLQRYVLNQNGDRIEVKNALNFAAQYDYDSRKQVIRSKSAMGVVLEYAYDTAARRIRERNGLSLAANAPTYLDRESETVRLNELSWDYDVFGRVIDHNNLSGRDSDYSYNASSGQMTGETAAGGSGIVTGNGSKTISYYANGRIRQVIEGTTTYRYEYDAAGNRTVEEVTTADIYGMQVRTLTRTTYDSNNRVERVTQDDVLTGKRVFDLITEYDANGNRRHVRAVSGYGPNVDGILVSNSAPVTIRTVDDRTVRKGLTSQFRLLFTDIFRDAEQDALSLTITQGSGAALPAWLVASRDPNTGEIVFTANPSAGLADQDIVVRLTATETANAANTISTTFTVRVRSNTAPALIQAGDIALRVKTNQPWNKDLIASDYFRDADVGDVLSLSIENALPSWLTIDASNPGAIRLSGTPTAPGTFIVRLRATDQQGAFVVKQFEITTAPNSTPSVVAAPTPVDAIISRQFDWTRDLSQVFTDLDGDRMQVTAKLSNGAALPAWMSFQYLYDQATPEIKFTGNVPTDEVNGRVYSIVLTATDVEGAFTTTTLTVNVFANRAPAPTANTLVLPPLRVNDNYSQTFAISALFNDPENDTLSLATLFPQGSALPAWLNMTVDYTAKTVTLSGRPTVNTQAGSFAFDVRATDIAGLTGVKSFSIVVGTDTAPARSAVPLAGRTLSINRSFTYTLPDGLFTDADGDAMTLSAARVTQFHESEPGFEFWYVEESALPSWLTFNAATRTFSGTVPANEPIGNFTVRVRATDSRGRVSAADNEFVGGAGDFVFYVQTWTNSAPIYIAGTLSGQTLVHGGAVNIALPGGAFTEPDGDVMTYSAQVLIGSTWTNISALGLSINATTGQITGTATNLTQASYSARIIANDPQGLTGIGSFTFSATNTPPTVGSIPTQNAGRNQAFSLALSTFFADVNNDPLTYSATGLPAGLTLNTATGAITGAATAALGSYTVTVSASDGRGGSIGTSFTLNVVNSAPVAPGVSNQTATAGSFFSYTPAAFTDPNGDALTYSASGLPAWLSFNPGTRTFSGTAGVVGSWYITYTATDTSGTASSTGFWVTTPSTPPVYSGGLSNQSASPGVGFSYTVPAGAFTDPNGDALTYSADANGAALPAWLSFNAATRTFSGTPSSAGSWTIRVMASDGTSTASGLFTISTANVGPVYNGTLPARSGTSGTGVSWTLPAGAFTDANGDALTYTLEVERPGYWETYWLAPGEPDTRWVEPVWVAASAVNLSIAANGTISGTLQALYSAGYDNVYQYYYDYNMRITARDPSNASAVGAFTVSANVAPVAPGIGTLTARQNSAYAYTLPAFSDANGNALSYSVSNLPPGLSFNSSTRAISGTPPTAGSWTVTYTANDGNGGVTNTTFTLIVQANNAPTPPSVGTQTGGVGGSLSLTLPAFTDADYDALSYSVSNLPPGLSFNTATRTISGTPTTVGSWTVTYTANDGRGGVSNTTFTFTINASAPANQAPVVSVPLDDQWTMSGDYFVYTIPAGSFTDPDNNPLTYTATQASGAALPAWLNFNASTRTFSGSPGGINNQTWTIRVRATDPSGLSVTDDFLLYKEGTGGGQPQYGVPVDDPSLQSAAIAPDPESLDGELMSRSWYIAPSRESPTPLPGPDVEPFGIAQSIVPDAAPAPQSDDDLVVAAADTLIAAAATTAAASSIPTNDVVPVAAAIDDTEAVSRVYSFDMGTGPALAGSAAIVEIQPTGNSSATAPVPMINALATSVPVQIKDEWFVYDAENRLKLVGGQLIGAAGAQGTYIGLGASGVASYELMYDAVGQVVGRSVKSGTNQIVYRTTYDLRGRKQYEFHGEYLNPVNFEFGGISRQYTYDAADRMIETRSYYQNGTLVQVPLDGEGLQGPDMHVSGWISSAETYTYDADGRLTLQINLERNNGINGIQWFEQWDYDDTLQRTSLTVLIEDSRVMYTDQFGNSGYDSIGRVSVYRYTAKDISWSTHTYTSSYEGWEGYVEKFISGVSTNNNYRATTNTLTYDAFGKLIKQIENTPLPSNLGVLEDRARAYTYNGDGRVQTRREGKIVSNVFTQTPDAFGANPNYLFVHAAGQQQAELREGGQIRYNSGYTYNTQQIQTLNGSGNYAAGGGTVTAQQGETLQSLAQRVYGNSSLWYVLADANGLSDPDAGLIAGTQLNTPKVNVSNNDANTFRPYDPSEAIGPTSPGLPYITPPPKKSCNVLAMIIIVVIAVVVTVYTAGAAASAFGATGTVGAGTATAGAAAGTVGAAATGTAITGAVTSGVVASTSIGAIGGAVLGGGALAGSIGALGIAGAAFIGGVAGSIASQVVGKALGVRDSFSLREVFAGGLASVASAGIAGVLNGAAATRTLSGFGAPGKAAASSVLNGVSNYAANRIAGVDVSFSWKSIAAGAVSAAITSAITPSISGTLGIESALGKDIVSGLVGGTVAMHVRRQFGVKTPIDYGQVVADAFGNAFGNAAVTRLVRSEDVRNAIDALDDAKRSEFRRLTTEEGLGAEAALDFIRNTDFWRNVDRKAIVQSLREGAVESLDAQGREIIAAALRQKELQDQGGMMQVAYRDGGEGWYDQFSREYNSWRDARRADLDQIANAVDGFIEARQRDYASVQTYIEGLREQSGVLARHIETFSESLPELAAAFREEMVDAAPGLALDAAITVATGLLGPLTGGASWAITAVNIGRRLEKIYSFGSNIVEGIRILGSAIDQVDNIGRMAAEMMSGEYSRIAASAAAAGANELALRALPGIENPRVQGLMTRALEFADNRFASAINSIRDHHLLYAIAKFGIRHGEVAERITAFVLDQSRLFDRGRIGSANIPKSGPMQNNSGHGIDYAGLNRWGLNRGEYTVFEVKAGLNGNAPGLQGDQRRGADFFADSRVLRATTGARHWRDGSVEYGATERARLMRDTMRGQNYSGWVISHHNMLSGRARVVFTPWRP